MSVRECPYNHLLIGYSQAIGLSVAGAVVLVMMNVHVYSPRFEVGVRVEGYEVGGETRHINSAFFTFRLVSSTVALPQLVFETKVPMQYYYVYNNFVYYYCLVSKRSKVLHVSSCAVWPY